jgi:hypothetical protein
MEGQFLLKTKLPRGTGIRVIDVIEKCLESIFDKIVQ